MESIREGEVHPLQNQVILDIIFDGLSLAELKACRQVCKEWLVAASKAMNGSVKVDERSFKFLPVLDNELCTFAASPFADTFKLSFNDSTVPSKFWEICGSHLKSLELWSVIFSSAEDFYHAILLSCPNLEELKLNYCHIQGPVDPSPPSTVFPELEGGGGNKSLGSLTFYNLHVEGSTFSWTKLIFHYPSLKVLNLEGYSESDDLFRSLEAVRRAEEGPCSLNLLGFDFDDIGGRYDMKDLLNACPALDTLNIDGFRIRRDLNALQRILESVSGTLKNLSLHSGGYLMRMRRGDALKLPNDGTFRQLQELDIYHPHELSMNFLRTFPTLRKLVLRFLDFFMLENTRDMEEMRGFVLPTCTELELYGPDEFHVEHVRMLGAWLPNVDKLKIEELRNETFALICAQWRNLTSLRSATGRLGDCAVTGLDLSDVERINEEGRTRNWRPITVPRANITSLKNLEVLSLPVPAWRIADATLGYSSVVCGIQHMANLKQLHLHGFDEDRDGEIWGPYLTKFPWKIRASY